jgi:hypothetical protein
MNGDGSRKILLHSTEGSSIAGAVGAFRANNSWPHLTVDCPRRHVVEHLDLMVAARSLRNTPGGADETNRDGTVLIQIEMVGSAVHPTTLGSPEDLTWFGREVLRPLHDLTGVPLVSSVRWESYPASFGANARQRLSPAAWDAYNGILGHQHAPDNQHGDPGSIDIAWIIRAATEEDDMTVDELLKALQKGPVRDEFKEIATGAGLDALRESSESRPDRGAWRAEMTGLINEVLDERDTPPS